MDACRYKRIWGIAYFWVLFDEGNLARRGAVPGTGPRGDGYLSKGGG